MKIKIKVTKEILSESRFCKAPSAETATSCAIALAVREIFPQAVVWRNCIWAFGQQGRIPLPMSATEFISEFDFSTPERRANMDEMIFEVEVPTDVIDAIGLSEVHRILKESKTLELV
jgi:hypothetical protein